jgi:hypothetical protein
VRDEIVQRALGNAHGDRAMDQRQHVGYRLIERPG